MTKVFLFCLTVLVPLSSTAQGEVKDETRADAPSEKSGRGAASHGLSFGNAGALFQSAQDLRAASESLAKFGESAERSSSNLGGTLEAIAEHLAQMSSGFDPLGLQKAFETVKYQSEVIREQQELINRLQQKEIQRLKRENQKLKNAQGSEKSELRRKKRKRTSGG